MRTILRTAEYQNKTETDEKGILFSSANTFSHGCSRNAHEHSPKYVIASRVKKDTYNQSFAKNVGGIAEGHMEAPSKI